MCAECAPLHNPPPSPVTIVAGSVVYRPRDLSSLRIAQGSDGKYYESWTVDTSTARKSGAFWSSGDRIITPEEYNRRRAEWEAEAARLEAAAAEAEADNAIWERYLASLPETIGDLRQGSLSPADLEDARGNYILSIPRKAAREAWSIERLTAWIAAQAGDAE